MTLNNVKDLLKKFADDHAQINDFELGPSESFTSKIRNYPAMWVVVPSASYTANALNYRMAVIFCDLLREDNSNELEVQSDMLSIGMDFVAYMTDNMDFDLYIDGDPSINFFTEKFTAYTSGVELTINLKDPKPLDRCVIPLD